MKIAFKKACL